MDAALLVLNPYARGQRWLPEPTRSPPETELRPCVVPGTALPPPPRPPRLRRGANVLVFCCPHQFIGGIVRQLYGRVDKDAIAVSLTKVGGFRV